MNLAAHQKAHPRACREHIIDGPRVTLSKGSSPRVREHTY